VSWIPRIGSEFAGYRLDALLGHGGMSIVYRAKHTVLERTVALKLLSPQLSEDESFRERFTRESRLAASLDHPNIIPIYEASESDGVFFIAMRYVEGSDLRTRLKEGPLPPQQLIGIVDQTANALAAAHAQGLVHRDVKPANILIDPGAGRGESDHVYLSDFGVAKQMSAPGLTKMGTFVGTADYASPEQIEGRALDARADVYSLGCVIYESLTGASAFDKDSEVALMYAHLLEPPPVVTASRPDLPPEIDEVVAKAMAKSPDDRYEGPKQLASALRDVLAGVPDEAVRAAQGAPATVFAAAPPATGAGPDATVVPGQAAMTGAATGAATGQAASPPPGPPPAGPDGSDSPGDQDGQGPPPAAGGARSRRGTWIAIAAALGLVAVAVVLGVLLLGGGDDDGGSANPAAPPPPAAGGGNEAPATLLEVLVPTEIATSCTTAATPTAPAVETEKCLPPESATAAFPNDLALDFFSSAGRLDAAYEKAKQGVTPAQCGVTEGERVWIHQATGQRGGRRFCYVDDQDRFVVVWTHEKLGSDDHVDMLGIAREPGRAPTTFGWWEALKDSIGKCRPRGSEVECFTTIQNVTT
jgi:serine/threonine-protein kinase